MHFAKLLPVAALGVLLIASKAEGQDLGAQKKATAQRGPWLEMQVGPMFQHEGGRAGLGTGPLVRMNLGMELGTRLVAELWAEGNIISSAPLASPQDRTQLGGGAGGRLLLYRFGAEGKLALWAHGGVGWAAAAPASGPHGPLGFAGPSLLFQPLLRRFALGVEVDAVVMRDAVGFALLPSLRCAL